GCCDRSIADLAAGFTEREHNGWSATASGETHTL
ncbi:MAG: hypothetical protein ACI88S_001792, partial [Ilumatobacter sp.]